MGNPARDLEFAHYPSFPRLDDMHWWQKGVIYNLFPLSFQDSNDDGFGDLDGVRARLDYLSWLGVDAIWLGPVFTSPLVDAGYDVSDFCDIDPVFGTLETFDLLLAECHSRGLRVLLDFAPNHTSDQHPWFIESRSSRANPRRDWYVWRDGKADGRPPTNWLDNTQQPSWEWDGTTGQYYYHRFLSSQPDLNLRNADVLEAILDAFRFWLRRGVDGFRIDGATHLVEDELLRDEPDGSLVGGPPGWMDRLYTTDRPESHEVLAAFRRVVDEFDDRVLLGEAVVPVARLMRYYGSEYRPEVHLPINSALMKAEPWTARRVEAGIDQFMQYLPKDATPNWQVGSHDVPRTAPRVGQAQGRIAAMLQLLLPGTTFLYYGDEIGLENIQVAANQVRDPYTAVGRGRDFYRAPMPWTADAGAGFSTAQPWLPLTRDFRYRNVAAQLSDQHSILQLVRRLIGLRHRHNAFQGHAYKALRSEGNVLKFQRGETGHRLLIAANISDKPATVTDAQVGRIILSTCLDREEAIGGRYDLRADEGVVIELA